MTTAVPGKEDVFSRIVNAAKHYRPDREGMPPPFVDVMVDFDGTYDNPDNVCTDCFTKAW